ncbi:ABC transporter permease [Mucilaginibacter gynuensis]|uniref:ABC transporter permease n=1 Tax=Mucilaginibacter gynuensis TaxID=1302236 RepID=A0ABP8GDB0_9SPHI
MIRNYIKMAWRNLVKNKVYAFINIAGLSVGMVVAILIGLWMWDELSFDKYHQNYSRIAQVKQHQSFDGTIRTSSAIPFPLGDEMRKSYGSDFKYMVMSSWTWKHMLSVDDKKISQSGTYMQPDAPQMLTLNMLKGTRNGLSDMSSVLISQSVSKALFGDADPMGKTLRIDNNFPVKVTGVYEDLPYNTEFYDTKFLAPWDLYITTEPWIKRSTTNWFNNSFQLFVQIADNADMARLSAKIKDVKLRKIGKRDMRFNPQIFLHGMDKWHLWSEFKGGVNTGGRIQYIYMFGAIGIFVLLLACINFMNLSTARSEKRAKEVGILKSIGSNRAQLIGQFFGESLMITALAFVVCLLMVQLCLPFFNTVADKKITILWTNPTFWACCLSFSLITGLIAGSYPALYLSSFKPVSVLKGTFRMGRFAAIPRQVLVVLQFTVSVVLIIGTVIVFRQIQHTKDRPVGYDRDGLLSIDMATADLHTHFAVLRQKLISSGAVLDVAESSSPVTSVNSNSSGLEWKGKDPNMTDDFGTIGITQSYGSTLGWQFIDGRDFSKDFLTDSSGIVINESAAKYMGMKHPVGETVKWGKNYKILGVIKDMVMQSPYEPAKQTIFYPDTSIGGVLNIRVNPKMSMTAALRTIEDVHKRYTQEPFSYKFADNEYAAKFSAESRIGKLAAFFTIVAIFISCLGLFGMASFMAEKRTKEIGIRKVLGATIFTLWRLLSKDFVVLAIIALVIAMPLSYYFMHSWLQNYQYRTEIAWWIFALAAVGAVVITLLTVSYQSIKAALANPVRSIKAE